MIKLVCKHERSRGVSNDYPWTYFERAYLKRKFYDQGMQIGGADHPLGGGHSSARPPEKG